MKNIKSKKTIVTLIAALLVVALGATFASARGGKGMGKGKGGPNLERATERMASELDLSSDQKEKVRAILSDSFDKRMALKERRMENREEHREAVQELHDKTDERLSEVLDSGQMKKLEKLREGGKDRREDRREDRRRGRRD